VICDDRAFLEFVRYYQSLPQVTGALTEQLRRMEVEFTEGEAELERRLSAKGVDISKLDGACPTSLTEKQDQRKFHDLCEVGGSAACVIGPDGFPFKGKSAPKFGGQLSNAASGQGASVILDPNHSIIKDIDGAKFRDFGDSCWILLTN
jgi:hypothetical protein